MSSNRLSGLNMALLAVTLCAVLFGLYGMLRPQNGASDHPRQNAPDIAQTDGESPSDASPGRKPPGEPRCGQRRPCTPGNCGRKAEDPAPMPDVSPKPAEGKPGLEGPSDRGAAGIAGTVFNAAGKPVAGASVTARRSDLDIQAPGVDSKDPASTREEVARYLEALERETRRTRTDGEGKFSFTGLDPKLAYNLAATQEGEGRAAMERVAAGDSVRMFLQPQSWLCGKVTGPGGTPVTHFSVEVYTRNNPWEAKEKTFSVQDGRFRMECQGGLLMVEISASGFCQPQPAEVTVDASGKEHAFVLGQAAILTGTVKDKAGKPLANANVFTGAGAGRWGNRGRGRNWEADGYGQQDVNAKTDSQGRYRLDTLAPREYRLSATYGRSDPVTQSITLIAGENTLDFTVDPGCRVILKLKDARQKPLEPGQVYFVGKEREWIQAERLPASEPGVAEFAGLKPGDYLMSVGVPGYPTMRRDVKLGATDQTIEIEVPDGAFLNSKVTSSTGGSLVGLSVRLLKEGESEDMAWGSGRWAQLKQDGTFKLGPVEPGSWSIELFTQSWAKVATEKRSLVSGDNSVEFSVTSGGSLSVRVTDEAGKPAGWAYVWIESLSTPGKNYGANTNQQGQVTLSFIEPGEYTLRVSAQALASPTYNVSVRNGSQELTVALKTPNCARVTSVTPNTQAAKIGLLVGDLIVEYNGEKVNSWGDIGRLRRKYKETDDVTITIERNGQLQTFNLKGGTIGIDGENAVR